MSKLNNYKLEEQVEKCYQKHSNKCNKIIATPNITDRQVEAFKDTRYDGVMNNPEKYQEFANYYKGDYIHDFYYAEGDIYEKLEALEQDKDDISQEQYEKQKVFLEYVLSLGKELTDEDKLLLLEFLEEIEKNKMLPFFYFYFLAFISHFIVEYYYPSFITDNIFIILIIGIIITLFLGGKMIKISDKYYSIIKLKNNLKKSMEDKKNSFEGIITLISKKRMRGHFLERDTYYKEVNKNILYYKDKIISVEKFKNENT